MPEFADWWNRLKAALPGDPNFDPYQTPGVTLNSGPPPAEPVVQHRTASPLVNITDQDINRATELATGFAGGGLATKPVIGGYRAQNTLDTMQNNLPSTTVGTHFTLNPNVAAREAAVIPPEGSLSNLRPLHTEPVVADINNYMRYPREPANWKDSFDVVEFIKMVEGMGGMKLPFPRGVLSGLESAAKQSGGLEKNMIPFLKEKGYDAIKYPAYNPGDPRLPLGKYDSFMAFDPGQVKSRFSPEGQELISSRGIKEAPKGLLWDDATKLWMNLPENLKNSILWIRQDPGALGTMSKDERRGMLELMTKLQGLK